MRKLTIDIIDVGGQPREGDYVLIQAPLLRGSSESAGAVIMTAPIRVDLRAGKGQVDVEPGPILVSIRSRSLRDSAPFEVTIPNGAGPVTLRSCMERRFRYQPAVETAVARDADRASEALRGAITAERKATEKATEAIEKVDKAVHAGALLVRDQVKTNADRAEAAVATVTAKTNEARQAAEAASASEATAGMSASFVQEAVGDANRSKTAAALSATAANNSATTAREAATTANNAASTAQTAATTAESYRDQAEQHAQHAETSKTAAASSADRAEAAARQAAVSAPEGGWEEEQLAQPVKDKLNKRVRLTEIEGIPSDVAGLSATSAGKTIAWRTPGGHLVASTPTDNSHVATKKYADEAHQKRDHIYTTSAAVGSTGTEIAPTFTRVRGSINYSRNQFMIGEGIYRITAATKGTEGAIRDLGTVKVKVINQGSLLAASDAAPGYLGSASVIVDTRGYPNAVATAVVNAKVTGFHMIVFIEDLLK